MVRTEQKKWWRWLIDHFHYSFSIYLSILKFVRNFIVNFRIINNYASKSVDFKIRKIQWRGTFGYILILINWMHFHSQLHKFSVNFIHYYNLHVRDVMYQLIKFLSYLFVPIIISLVHAWCIYWKRYVFSEYFLFYSLFPLWVIMYELCTIDVDWCKVQGWGDFLCFMKCKRKEN